MDNIICVKTDLPVRQNMDTKLVLKTCFFCVLFVMTIGLSDDEMMQAACTAIAPPSTFISAVRKPCLSSSENCETICRTAICSMRKLYWGQGSAVGTCIETFHLYHSRYTLKNGETGKATIGIQRYGKNSCKSQTGCGPNFCCCIAQNSA